MTRNTSSAWMFYDWPTKSLGHDTQAINLAFLRLFVVALYKPILRPLMRWLVRK